LLTLIVRLSSMWNVAKDLCVHHKHVLAIISRCKVMDDNGFALWSLSIKKEKKDWWVAWIVEKGSIGMVDFKATN
jgi:hypothetical protein